VVDALAHKGRYASLLLSNCIVIFFWLCAVCVCVCVISVSVWCCVSTASASVPVSVPRQRSVFRAGFCGLCLVVLRVLTVPGCELAALSAVAVALLQPWVSLFWSTVSLEPEGLPAPYSPMEPE
jgi:hypothetical protein